MEYFPGSDQQAGKANDREDIDKNVAEKEEDREPVEREYEDSGTYRENKREGQEGRNNVNPPVNSEASSKSSRRSRKVKIPLAYKILAVVAVIFNFYYIWNFMKEPAVPFYQKLMVLGICAGINFIAVWVVFSNRSLVRFYLALFAILGSVGYYFYINYTNHSFLGRNLITLVLMIIFVLMVINRGAHYYLKSIMLLLIPIIGIYLSSNKLALVWILMGSAGLILLFRLPQLQAKQEAKLDRKKKRGRRNQNESA